LICGWLVTSARKITAARPPGVIDRCPLWVISGHCRGTSECPLYPRKRTSPKPVVMSA